MNMSNKWLLTMILLPCSFLHVPEHVESHRTCWTNETWASQASSNAYATVGFQGEDLLNLPFMSNFLATQGHFTSNLSGECHRTNNGQLFGLGAQVWNWAMFCLYLVWKWLSLLWALHADMLAMPLSAKHTQETPLQARVGRSWF